MNKIILNSKSGKIENIILDENDLSKTSADLMADLKTVNGEMRLLLELKINDKFEIKFV